MHYVVIKHQFLGVKIFYFSAPLSLRLCPLISAGLATAPNCI